MNKSVNTPNGGAEVAQGNDLSLVEKDVELKAGLVALAVAQVDHKIGLD